jgi:hypothetical protein
LSRRVSLPTADDLFRPTDEDEGDGASQPSRKVAAVPDRAKAAKAAQAAADEAEAKRSSSGRVRHDEKMTVYVTADELIDIEHARLSMRRHHGLAVDRGRLVREAIAIALADLEENGEESVLVQRLIGP